MQLEQHQVEIEQNLRFWQSKPLLRDVYADFYRRIVAQIDRSVSGAVLEIGSGIGNLKTHFPGAICSDLFPNPWLDIVCDGYELPFANGSISHLVLFDVFHHLERPLAFLNEARRALAREGRLIVFDPYISLSSFPVYGLLHHEPVAWRQQIDLHPEPPPQPRGYYAAQGNATRLLLRDCRSRRKEALNPSGKKQVSLLTSAPTWKVVHAEAFAAFSYLLSGGYSKPAMYPRRLLRAFQALDATLSGWPKVFGGRCLVALTPS